MNPGMPVMNPGMPVMDTGMNVDACSDGVMLGGLYE